MSKVIILSVQVNHEGLLKTKLTNKKILFKDTKLIPQDYMSLFSIQLITDYELTYHCKNIYEINESTPQKKEFDEFISCLKELLMVNPIEVHLCVQWDGNNSDDINDLYEQQKINLFTFYFPEDEFEFDYNVDYVFVYKK